MGEGRDHREYPVSPARRAGSLPMYYRNRPNSKYQINRRSDRFKIGNIIVARWVAPSLSRRTAGSYEAQNNRILMKLRPKIVIRIYKGHVLASPVFTDNGQGMDSRQARSRDDVMPLLDCDKQPGKEVMASGFRYLRLKEPYKNPRQGSHIYFTQLYTVMLRHKIKIVGELS